MLIVVLSLLLGGVVGHLYYVQSNVQVIDIADLVPETTRKVTPRADKEPVDLSTEDVHEGKALNLLIIGSDSRDSKENIELGGAEKVTGMRSDVTMIAHINAKRTKIKLVSIPRDSWVDIPRCKRADGTESAPSEGKFNGAFAAGGATGDLTSAVACTVNTVQHLTDLRIDGFVVADFAGLAGLVDSLGGIEVDVPRDIESENAGDLVLKAGIQTLDGPTALQYSRARSGKGLTGSDLTRISHQHQVMHAIAEKLKSQIKNPASTLGILEELASTFAVSPSLEPRHALGLGWALRSTKIESVDLPVRDRGDGANLLWAEEADEIWDSFRVK